MSKGSRMAKENKVKPGFNPVFDWLASDPTKTSTEKLIIAHILRWGRGGCHEDTKDIAINLGINDRTLERAAKSLYERELITFGYDTVPKTWFVTDKLLIGKHVFDGLKGCGKPVSYDVKSLDIQRNQGWRFAVIYRRFAGLGVAFCRLFYRKRRDLYRDYREKEEKRKKKIRDKCSQIIVDNRKKRGKPSVEQLNRQRQKLLEQVKGLSVDES